MHQAAEAVPALDAGGDRDDTKVASCGRMSTTTIDTVRIAALVT
jgi:hypothetical protein